MALPSPVPPLVPPAASAATAVRCAASVALEQQGDAAEELQEHLSQK